MTGVTLAAHARDVSLKLHLRDVLDDLHAFLSGQLAAPHLVEALTEELALESTVTGRQAGVAAAIWQFRRKRGVFGIVGDEALVALVIQHRLADRQVRAAGSPDDEDLSIGGDGVLREQQRRIEDVGVLLHKHGDVLSAVGRMALRLHRRMDHLEDVTALAQRRQAVWPWDSNTVLPSWNNSPSQLSL